MSGEYAHYPWLFRGAYAIYRGTSKVGHLPGEFDITDEVRVEDIDLANKRVKLHDHSIIVQRIWRMTKKVSETDLADWIRIGERTLISDSPVIPEGECEGQTRVEGLGVRRCIIQQYAIRQNTAIVFWDKEYNWPLQLIAIFRYKSRSSPSPFETILDGAMEAAEFWVKNWDYSTRGDLNLNMQDGLKKSRSVVLRESSIAISLKETNIRFMPPPPPPPRSTSPLPPPPPNYKPAPPERIVQCEYLMNGESCKAIDKNGWTGRESCLNHQKDYCCYQCSLRESCQISCEYLDKKPLKKRQQ